MRKFKLYLLAVLALFALGQPVTNAADMYMNMRNNGTANKEAGIAMTTLFDGVYVLYNQTVPEYISGYTYDNGTYFSSAESSSVDGLAGNPIYQAVSGTFDHYDKATWWQPSQDGCPLVVYQYPMNPIAIATGTWDIYLDTNTSKMYVLNPGEDADFLEAYQAAEPEPALPTELYLFGGGSWTKDAQVMTQVSDGVYEIENLEVPYYMSGYQNYGISGSARPDGVSNWRNLTNAPYYYITNEGAAPTVFGGVADDVTTQVYDLSTSDATFSVASNSIILPVSNTYTIRVDLNEMKLTVTRPEPAPALPEQLFIYYTQTGDYYPTAKYAVDKTAEGVFKATGFELSPMEGMGVGMVVFTSEDIDVSNPNALTGLAQTYVIAEAGGEDDYIIEPGTMTLQANNGFGYTFMLAGTFDINFDFNTMQIVVAEAAAPEPEYPKALYFFTGADWNAAGTAMTQVSEGIYELEYEMPVASSGSLNCGISAAQKTDNSTSWRKTPGIYYYNAARPTIFGGLAEDILEDQISLIATDGTANFSAANNVIPVAIPTEGENPTYKFVVDLVNMTLTVTRPAPAVEPEPVKMYLFASMGINTYSEAQEMNDLGDGVYELKGVELALFDQNWKDAAFKLTDTLNENGQAVGTYVAGNSVDDLAPSETPYDLKKSSSTIAIPTYVGTYDIKVDLENMKLWLTTTPEPEPAGSIQFERPTNSNWKSQANVQCLEGGSVTETIISSNSTSAAGDYYLFEGIPATTEEVHFYSLNGNRDSGPFTYVNGGVYTSKGLVVSENYTVKYDNGKTAWDKVYVQVLDATNNSTWPGYEMTLEEGTIWTVTFTPGFTPTTIVFNDGGAYTEAQKTEELAFEDGKTYGEPADPEPEYPENLYIFTRTWSLNPATAMTNEGNGVYTVKNFVMDALLDYMGDPTEKSWVSITDNETQSSGTLYYGLADGVAFAADTDLAVQEGTKIINGGIGTYDITLDLANMTIRFDTVSDPEPEYPENLYIFTRTWSLNPATAMTNEGNGVYTVKNFVMDALLDYMGDPTEKSWVSITDNETQSSGTLYYGLADGVAFAADTDLAVQEGTKIINGGIGTYDITLDLANMTIRFDAAAGPEAPKMYIYWSQADGYTGFCNQKAEMTEVESGVYEAENLTFTAIANFADGGFIISPESVEPSTANLQGLTSCYWSGRYVALESGVENDYQLINYMMQNYVNLGTYTVRLDTNTGKLVVTAVEPGSESKYAHVYAFAAFAQGGNPYKDRIEMTETETNVYTLENVTIVNAYTSLYANATFWMTDEDVDNLVTASQTIGGADNCTYVVGDEGNAVSETNVNKLTGMPNFCFVPAGTYNVTFNADEMKLYFESVGAPEYPEAIYMYGDIGKTAYLRDAIELKKSTTEPGVYTNESVMVMRNGFQTYKADNGYVIFTTQQLSNGGKATETYKVGDLESYGLIPLNTAQTIAMSEGIQYYALEPGTYSFKINLADNTLLVEKAAMPTEMYAWGTFGASTNSRVAMTAEGNGVFTLQNVDLQLGNYAGKAELLFTPQNYDSMSELDQAYWVDTEYDGWSALSNGTYDLSTTTRSANFMPVVPGTYDVRLDLAANTVTLSAGTAVEQKVWMWGTFGTDKAYTAKEMTAVDNNTFEIKNVVLNGSIYGANEGCYFFTTEEFESASAVNSNLYVNTYSHTNGGTYNLIEGKTSNYNTPIDAGTAFDFTVDLTAKTVTIAPATVEPTLPATLYAWGTLDGNNYASGVEMTTDAEGVYTIQNLTIAQPATGSTELVFAAVGSGNIAEMTIYGSSTDQAPALDNQANVVVEGTSANTNPFYLGEGVYDVKVDLNEMKAYFAKVDQGIEALYAYGTINGAKDYQPTAMTRTAPNVFELKNCTIDKYYSFNYGPIRFSEEKANNWSSIGGTCYGINNYEYPNYGENGNSLIKMPNTNGIYMIKLTPGEYDIKVDLNTMKVYFIQLNIPVVEIDPLYAYGSFGGEAYQTQVKFDTYEEYGQTYYRINDLPIEAYGDTDLGVFTLSKKDVANGLEAGEYYNAISTQDFTKQMNLALSSTMNPFTPQPGIYDVRVSLNGNNPWISFDRHPDSWAVEPENTPCDVNDAWLRLAPTWASVPMTKASENVFEAEINVPSYISGGSYGAFFLTDLEEGKIQDLQSAYGFYGYTGMATLGEEGNDMWHGTTENLDMVKVPVGKCVVKADFNTMTLTIEVVKEPEPEKDYLWYAGGMNGWKFDFAEIIEGKATFNGTFDDDLGFKVSTNEPSGQYDGWEGFNAGALTTETVLTSGATVNLTAGEGNITLAESGNWTIVVDVENKTITATGGTSIETIEGVEAEAVYFTLQGARVDNPAPGIVYIVRRGANVTKELYFTK